MTTAAQDGISKPYCTRRFARRPEVLLLASQLLFVPGVWSSEPPNSCAAGSLARAARSGSTKPTTAEWTLDGVVVQAGGPASQRLALLRRVVGDGRSQLYRPGDSVGGGQWVKTIDDDSIVLVDDQCNRVQIRAGGAPSVVALPVAPRAEPMQVREISAKVKEPPPPPAPGEPWPEPVALD